MDTKESILDDLTGDNANRKSSGILKLLSFQKVVIIELIIISIIYAFLNIFGTLYIKFLFDYVLLVRSSETLIVISIGFLFLSVFAAVVNLFRFILVLIISQKIDFSLMSRIYMNIFRFPTSIIDRIGSGEITTRVAEIQKIRNMIASGSILLLADIIIATLTGILLFIQCPQLLYVLLPLSITFILIILTFNKLYRIAHKKSMGKHVKLNSLLSESLFGIVTIKAYNYEKIITKKLEKLFEEFIELVGKAQSLQNFQYGAQEIITNMAAILILWVGSIQVLESTITAGQLLAFNALLILITSPIKKLISVHSLFQAGAIAAERLSSLDSIKCEQENEDTKVQYGALKYGITYYNVSFSYGDKKNVVSNLSLEINKGDCVGIIGESGSGKSTLLKMLLGLYEPSDGEILVDNVDLKDINLKQFRSTIGYVPQDPFVFNDTYLENIRFGRKEYGLKDVIKITKMLKLHSHIAGTANRYNTIIDERGSNISGGQKQRIALSRALLGKPDLLILDESTSNIDAKTEDNIIKRLEEIRNFGTTIVMTTHRRSVLSICNRIFTISGGNLKEESTLYRKINYN